MIWFSYGYGEVEGHCFKGPVPMEHREAIRRVVNERAGYGRLPEGMPFVGHFRLPGLWLVVAKVRDDSTFCGCVVTEEEYAWHHFSPYRLVAAERPGGLLGEVGEPLLPGSGSLPVGVEGPEYLPIAARIFDGLDTAARREEHRSIVPADGPREGAFFFVGPGSGQDGLRAIEEGGKIDVAAMRRDVDGLVEEQARLRSVVRALEARCEELRAAAVEPPVSEDSGVLREDVERLTERVADMEEGARAVNTAVKVPRRAAPLGGRLARAVTTGVGLAALAMGVLLFGRVNDVAEGAAAVADRNRAESRQADARIEEAVGALATDVAGELEEERGVRALAVESLVGELREFWADAGAALEREIGAREEAVAGLEARLGQVETLGEAQGGRLMAIAATETRMESALAGHGSTLDRVVERLAGAENRLRSAAEARQRDLREVEAALSRSANATGRDVEDERRMRSRDVAELLERLDRFEGAAAVGVAALQAAQVETKAALATVEQEVHAVKAEMAGVVATLAEGRGAGDVAQGDPGEHQRGNEEDPAIRSGPEAESSTGAGGGRR